jgi:hypothetical protein
MTTLLVVLICLGEAGSTLQAEEIRKELSPNGRIYRVSLISEEVDSLLFYLPTEDSNSFPFKLQVTAPIGASIEVLGATESIDSGHEWVIPLQTRKEIRAVGKTCVPLRPPEEEEEGTRAPGAGVFDTSVCTNFDPADLYELAQSLTAHYGTTHTSLDACSYLVFIAGGVENVTPNPTLQIPHKFASRKSFSLPITLESRILENNRQPIRDRSQTIRSRDHKEAAFRFERYGIMNKDACSNPNTQYYLLVRVNLSAVDRRKQKRLSVTARVRYQDYTGLSIASIKPVSDGRFAPDPLILMHHLGHLCGHRIHVVEWENKIPVRRTLIPVEDMIQWRDFVLVRSPIAAYLTGGLATFELTDTNRGYSACFTLERIRQRANGYPE